jgi:hypothetical protein
MPCLRLIAASDPEAKHPLPRWAAGQSGTAELELRPHVDLFALGVP